MLRQVVIVTLAVPAIDAHFGRARLSLGVRRLRGVIGKGKVLVVVILSLLVHRLNFAPRVAAGGVVLYLHITAKTALHIELTRIHCVVCSSDTARGRLTLQLRFIRFLAVAL